MQKRPEHDSDPAPSNRTKGVLIRLAIAAVVIILIPLRLTGVNPARGAQNPNVEHLTRLKPTAHHELGAPESRRPA